LGNFVSRVLAMQQKYFDGVVQPLSSNWAAEDLELRDKFAQAEHELEGHMQELQFHRALEAVWSSLDHANRYIVQTAPFTIIKDAGKRGRVGEVLHHLLEVVRTMARVLPPFMPETAVKLCALLEIGEDRLNVPWGLGLAAGHKVNPPVALFSRIIVPGTAELKAEVISPKVILTSIEKDAKD
jgi:methionyl-tRNA synthetase